MSEDTIDLLKKSYRELPLDNWLAEMSRLDVPYIEAVKLVREVCDVRLGRAKQLIDANAAWKAKVQMSQSIRELALQSLIGDGEDSPNRE